MTRSPPIDGRWSGLRAGSIVAARGFGRRQSGAGDRGAGAGRRPAAAGCLALMSPALDLAERWRVAPHDGRRAAGQSRSDGPVQSLSMSASGDLRSPDGHAVLRRVSRLAAGTGPCRLLGTAARRQHHALPSASTLPAARPNSRSGTACAIPGSCSRRCSKKAWPRSRRPAPSSRRHLTPDRRCPMRSGGRPATCVATGRNHEHQQDEAGRP